ncbi:MAG TPA: NB-ARC domain-containing protein [Candidatus Fermentibacter daniensis]|nr:NB-ARC domain-containing protein [Candidatus Fermentibacter daniensis]HPN63166.1 NB-ARC domain-containing protein [Candidatus Fermentibacter daniensis]
MNSGRILQYAVTQDLSKNVLKYLIDCRGECEHLDFKEALAIEVDYECANFARDVLAMKNVGGGYIVIGVEDKTWKPVGLSSALPYDTKMLCDKVCHATGVNLALDIVHHNVVWGDKSLLFALILIRASAKRQKLKVPTMPQKDFFVKEKWGIRRGDIYTRIGDQTKRVSSEEELQSLILELEARYQEQNLEEAKREPSPFAVDSGLYRLLPSEYDSFVGRIELQNKIKSAIERDPRIWIINLYGPGGVGKSALATRVAYDYYRESSNFEAILQLSAKDIGLTAGTGIRKLQPTLVSLEDLLDRILVLFEHSEFCDRELDVKSNKATEILSAYRTLLVLDNMEAVNDGRIMAFVRELPPEVQTKVVLTSRRRTSEWEYPIQVTEFNLAETKDFVITRSKEMNIGSCLCSDKTIEQLHIISGGLPLAIQWILGEYATVRELEPILKRAIDRNSPLLEFSFRNSWMVLNQDAQEALAVLSVFDVPPLLEEWRLSLDWPTDRLEKAISDLVAMTFVTERSNDRTGSLSYSSLPITLSFARNQLAQMGDLEVRARTRLQDYRNRLQLASVETSQYTDLFSRFDAREDNQKRAIILARMAEGQTKTFRYDGATEYYKQALDLNPNSVYALVSCALFMAELGRYSEALELVVKASKHCTKKSGFYVYFNMAKLYDQLRERPNRAIALRKALEYEPNNIIARHSLGVAISQMGNYTEAIQVFESIISEERTKPDGPSDSLSYALHSKAVTLLKARRYIEAADLCRTAVKELKELRLPYDQIEQLLQKLEDEQYNP